MSTDEKKDTLEESLYKTISGPTIDVTGSLIEIGFDSVLAEGILKDIPVVNTLKSLVKAGFSVRDRLFLKKLFEFMTSAPIDRKGAKFVRFKNKLEEKNQQDKLSHHLLELIDKTIENEKIPIYSRLFSYVIEHELDWIEFYHLSLCLSNLHPLGVEFLRELAKDKALGAEISIPRDFRESFLASAGLSARYGSQVHLNELGIKLYRYCLS